MEILKIDLPLFYLDCEEKKKAYLESVLRNIEYERYLKLLEQEKAFAKDLQKF